MAAFERDRALDEGGRGHAVEGVVDLDRVEDAGVEREHRLGGDLLRVEPALPLGIVVAGGADVNHLITLSC